MLATFIEAITGAMECEYCPSKESSEEEEEDQLGIPVHCQCWYDCEPCCRCGFEGGEGCDCPRHNPTLYDEEGNLK